MTLEAPFKSAVYIDFRFFWIALGILLVPNFLVLTLGYSLVAMCPIGNANGCSLLMVVHFDEVSLP